MGMGVSMGVAMGMGIGMGLCVGMGVDVDVDMGMGMGMRTYFHGYCRVAPFLGGSPPDRSPCSRFGPPNKTAEGFGRRPCPAAVVVL